MTNIDGQGNSIKLPEPIYVTDADSTEVLDVTSGNVRFSSEEIPQSTSPSREHWRLLSEDKLVQEVGSMALSGRRAPDVTDDGQRRKHGESLRSALEREFLIELRETCKSVRAAAPDARPTSLLHALMVLPNTRVGTLAGVLRRDPRDVERSLDGMVALGAVERLGLGADASYRVSGEADSK